MAGKLYPCVGGPLDKVNARREDFQKEWLSPTNPIWDTPAGQFVQWTDEYVQYNRADRHKDTPTMIWLWKGLL